MKRLKCKLVKCLTNLFQNLCKIVMEYCGAGSVLDIMKLRGIHFGLPRGEVKPLNEEEIATVLTDTLKGSIFVY